MSTELRKNDTALHSLPKLSKLSVGIAVAEWNSHITEALLAGAMELFAREGYTDIDVHHVPGTVELTFAASRMVHSGRYDAVIVFGCVIRGGTPHFDYVCDSITRGVASLNAEGRVPVIFGVLTTDDEQQAIDRAGGALGNKGTEAAEAAIKMCDFSCKFQ